jgi:hypothetical protein
LKIFALTWHNMKPKEDGVHYVRVWHRQILYKSTSDTSIIPLATDGNCTVTADSRTIILETGREIRVGKGTDASFGDNKAHLLVIHRT